MSSVSLERAREVLLRGAAKMSEAVNRLPAGSAVSERAKHVCALVPELTWCVVRGDGVYMLFEQRPTDVWIVLVPNNQLTDPSSAVTFRTTPREDGSLHVYARTVAFTPLWAGLCLFHELSHVYDFRTGVEPRDPSPNEYNMGEARAFHLEAVLLDTVTNGRLSLALEKQLSTPLSPEELASDRGAEVADDLERVTGVGSPPAGSDSEVGVRSAAHRMAALLAFEWHTANLRDIDVAEEAGNAYGRFATAFGSMPQA